MTAETRVIQTQLTPEQAGRCVTSGGPEGTLECRNLRESQDSVTGEFSYSCAAAAYYKGVITKQRLQRIGAREGRFTGPSGVTQCTNGYTDNSVHEMLKLEPHRLTR